MANVSLAWNLYCFELLRRPGRSPGTSPARPRRVLVACPLAEAAAFGAGAHRDEWQRRVGARPWDWLEAQRPVRGEETADFFQILGSALVSGQPILGALAMCARQARSPKMRGVVAAIAHLVGRGGELHDGFRLFPRIFSPVQVALARAASESGLDQAGALYVQLALRMQRDSKLGRKFAGALAYPLFLLILSLAAALVLELKALPPMVELFRSMGAELPAVTRCFYEASRFLADHASLLVPAAAAGTALMVAILPVTFRNATFQRLCIRLWVVGPIVLCRSLSRALGTFLLLKQSGANNRDIFHLAAASAGNATVSDFFHAAYGRVSSGESLEEAFLAERDALGEEGVRLAGRIEVGMEGADLGPLLRGMIDDLTDRAETRAALLPRMLELPMLALCGLVIGLILLAMFLPYPSLLADVARQMRGR
jgi:type II secretory pathway component PulF